MEIFSWSQEWGVFFIGFVFGYLLLYSVRHTKDFSVELLGSAIGAVGGAAVTAWLGHIEGWIGPYGRGLFLGFFFYALLSAIFVLKGKPSDPTKATFADSPNLKTYSQIIIGSPRE